MPSSSNQADEEASFGVALPGDLAFADTGAREVAVPAAEAGRVSADSPLAPHRTCQLR
jgi:hypothetical protein